MGGDGGTLGVIRKYAPYAPSSEAKADAASRRWNVGSGEFFCAISQEPLREPVVACRLGILYNKEALILKMLEKTLDADLFGHIRTLRDVVQCKFTLNPGRNQRNGSSSKTCAQYMCPVTQVEMTGGERFCVLVPSGRIVSLRALKKLPDLCKGETTIELFPRDDDIEQRRAAFLKSKSKTTSLSLQQQTKKKRKKKQKRTKSKNKRKIGEVKKSLQSSSSSSATASKVDCAAKKQKTDVFASIFNDNNTSSSRDSAKRLFTQGNTRGDVRC